MKCAGWFIFGGKDENNKACDDLHLFTMNLERNRDRVTSKTAEYKPSAIGAVELWGEKVKTKGKGPCARFKHSAEVFKN
jgi:hypothetical protein